jgi:hypothetical protein
MDAAQNGSNSRERRHFSRTRLPTGARSAENREKLDDWL